MTYKFWYEMEAAAGAIGAVSTVNKFGRNIDIDFGTDEDIWDGGGDWVAPTDARIHAIVSSSADDANEGAGTWTITVEGLGADWKPQSETVTLAGTSPVNTVNAYRRIFRMSVVTGAADNVGTITATAATDSTVTAQINPGNNQTLMAIYTVPAGYQAFLFEYYFGLDSVTVPGASSDARMNCKLLVKPSVHNDNTVFQVKHVRGAFVNGSSSFEQHFSVPIRIDGPADIKLRATDAQPSGLANADVTGGFDLVLREL